MDIVITMHDVEQILGLDTTEMTMFDLTCLQIFEIIEYQAEKEIAEFIYGNDFSVMYKETGEIIFKFDW
jgi:hypothetical protein